MAKLQRASEILPAIVRPGLKVTPIQRRLIDAAYVENPTVREILFQHTVFCQTSLPYRDPGENVRTWERLNGNVHLEVNAGKAMHPEQGKFVPVGLPFGPKCRLLLMHINQQAIATQSPEIKMGNSLSAFVHRVLKLDSKGRNIRLVKDQLARLAACSIRLGVVKDGRAFTVNSQIVTAFDIWFPKDERQRVLWPSTIWLSHDYFESLNAEQAVPLIEAHIAALSHSALALDIYVWLAQRLHRIPVDKPAPVSWTALHAQFGQGYNGERGIRKFREVFRVALDQVLRLYKDAKVEDEERKRPSLIIQGDRSVWREPPAKGLMLYHSKTPVPPRIFPVG